MVRVTLSGTPGSGKSTVAALVQTKKNLTYIYSGDLFRKLAMNYGMSVQAFSTYCETHPTIDKELDDKQLEYLQQQDNILVEGRLAGWLAYIHTISAVKVYITADETIRAKRIVKREGGTLPTRKQELQQRQHSEAQRYKAYYNIDITDVSIYDLILDSSEKTPEELSHLIIQALP